MSQRLVVTLLLITSFSPNAASQELQGLLGVRGLYSGDGQATSPTIAIGFIELDVAAKELTANDLELRLSGTFAHDATNAKEQRFGRTDSFQQIRQLYVKQPGLNEKLDIIVGRRLISQSGQAWIDGIEAALRIDPSWEIGLYGGFRPDPITYGFEAEAQAIGGYVSLRRKGLDGDAGYFVAVRDGIDRQYFFQRLHMKLSDGLYASNYLIFDVAEQSEVATLLGSIDYTPIRPLNFSLNVSRYSLAQYRETVIYQNVVEPNQALILGDEVLDLVYNRVRFSALARLNDHVSQYQSVEYKHRSQDDREAWLLTIGVRDDDLFEWGTRVDVYGTFRNDFASDSFLLATEGDHPLTDFLILSFRFTYFNGRTIDRFSERGRTFDEAQRIFLVGGGFFWRPQRSHQLGAHYDGIHATELQDARNEEDLFIHTAMLRYTYLL